MAESIQTKTILVADDDSDMRTFIGSILHEMGYAIIYANDGDDAWLKIHDSVIDLIVLDIMMPNLHGLGLLDLLKKNESKIPVIMASARHDAQTWAASINLGAKKFLHKPFTAEALIAAVEKAIGKPAAKASSVTE